MIVATEVSTSEATIRAVRMEAAFQRICLAAALHRGSQLKLPTQEVRRPAMGLPRRFCPKRENDCEIVAEEVVCVAGSAVLNLRISPRDI